MANDKQTEAIQNVANAIDEVAAQMYNMRDAASEFNGYTIADSLGIIADAMFKIAEALEKK